MQYGDIYKNKITGQELFFTKHIALAGLYCFLDNETIEVFIGSYDFHKNWEQV